MSSTQRTGRLLQHCGVGGLERCQIGIHLASLKSVKISFLTTIIWPFRPEYASGPTLGRCQLCAHGVNRIRSTGNNIRQGQLSEVTGFLFRLYIYYVCIYVHSKRYYNQVNITSQSVVMTPYRFPESHPCHQQRPPRRRALPAPCPS